MPLAVKRTNEPNDGKLVKRKNQEPKLEQPEQPICHHRNRRRKATSSQRRKLKINSDSKQSKRIPLIKNLCLANFESKCRTSTTNQQSRYEKGPPTRRCGLDVPFHSAGLRIRSGVFNDNHNNVVFKPVGESTKDEKTGQWAVADNTRGFGFAVELVAAAEQQG
jgi:hypothetical protein